MNLARTATRRTTQTACALLAANLTSSPLLAQTGQDDTPDEDSPQSYDEEPEEEGEVGTFGYDPDEGFRLKSEDGNYRLRLGITSAFKFEPVWTNGEHEISGILAFVRPSFSGNFYQPWIRYAVAMELAGSEAFLLGANIEVQPWDEFGFRFGQQGTPVSRHTSFGPSQIFFPDYSIVSGYFWSGRNKGLTLFGSAGEDRVDYWLGLYGGSPLRDPIVEEIDEPLNYIAEARATISPLGPVNANELPFTPDGDPLPTRFSFTLQGYHGKLQTIAENYNPTNSILTPERTLESQVMTSAGADVWFQTGPLILFAEGFWRRFRTRSETDSHPSYGVWGEAMANVFPNVIGAGARVSYLDPNGDIDEDRVFEAEGQLAWFIDAPQLVLKLRYAYLHQQTPDEVAQGDFVLPFPTGTSHVLTTQLTMAF